MAHRKAKVGGAYVFWGFILGEKETLPEKQRWVLSEASPGLISFISDRAIKQTKAPQNKHVYSELS